MTLVGAGGGLETVEASESGDDAAVHRSGTNTLRAAVDSVRITGRPQPCWTIPAVMLVGTNAAISRLRSSYCMIAIPNCGRLTPPTYKHLLTAPSHSGPPRPLKRRCTSIGRPRCLAGDGSNLAAAMVLSVLKISARMLARVQGLQINGAASPRKGLQRH
jgi:hypothetical protein